MKIFKFSNYRDFVTNTVRSLPKSGRGELLRIATHLGIHTSTLSQVLSGLKNFTLDQGCSLADYFGLNDLETRYLFHLIELERAGTEKLRLRLKKELAAIKDQSKNLSSIIPGTRELTEQEKAVFYSNWFYTGIWAATSIPGRQTPEELARYFGIPRFLVNQVIAFLVRTGLCVEENGKLSPGTTYVHLASGSPFIARHHSSWRQKAIERQAFLSEEEIAYSSPMSLSKDDAVRIRALIVDWVEQVNKIRDPSPCEELYFLNIDWIKF